MTMPDCMSIETLRSWLADELATSQRRAVGSHVAGCSACQARLDTETQNATLRHWLDVDPNCQLDDADLAISDKLLSESRLPFARPLPGGARLSRQTAAVAGVTEPEPEADIGRIGVFRLLDELGRGGMGIVYRAWDVLLRRVVALKVLRPEYAGADDRLRLVREAQLASKFQSDYAVTVHAVVDPPDGPPYLVMEYVQGPTLAKLIDSGGALPRREVAGLIVQAALAVDAAHAAGLVHRDVKPSNILIDAATGRAKITDFGVARALAAPSGVTREGVVAGTPAYMSPEQARGESHVDPRIDVYGLGATLYEGLTGQPPFAGAEHAILRRIDEEDPIPPRRLDPEIPLDLETICLKAMAKEPGQRDQTARDLGDDLSRWLRNEPIRARPATRRERAWRWCRRRPATAALISVTLLAAVALLASSLAYSARVTAAYRLAEQHRQDAESRRREADAQRAEADAQRREAESRRARSAGAGARPASRGVRQGHGTSAANLGTGRRPAGPGLAGEISTEFGRGGPARLRVVLPVAVCQRPGPHAHRPLGRGLSCGGLARRPACGHGRRGPRHPALGYRDLENPRDAARSQKSGELGHVRARQQPIGQCQRRRHGPTLECKIARGTQARPLRR